VIGLIMALSAIPSWTVAAQPLADAPGTRQAQLSYVCGGRDGSNASFIFSSPLRLGGHNGHSTWREIKFRVDEGPVVTSLWRYGDFKAVAAQRNNAAELSKLLPGGRRLAVWAMDQNGNTIAVSFDITDAANAIRATDQACELAEPRLAYHKIDDSSAVASPITTAIADR
jgi:hypothetical protein